MKLRLKNFRCYVDQEFDFGSDGLLLLSGPSGSGKSTILMAINFVLYGTGTKLTTFGKTSCQVDMDFDELIIKRTKKPNRLVLTNTNTDEEHEDDSAQAIINERFGFAFDITSYVQQNAMNSFILMSPIEKLSFLEKFSFHGLDLSQIKARCQAIIKKRNEDLIACTSQLEMANNHFTTLLKPSKVAFPFKTKDKQKSIDNELIRLKNSKIMVKRTEKNLTQAQKELNAVKILSIKLENSTKVSDIMKEKIEQLTFDLDTTHYEGDSKLEEYEKQLSVLLSHRELYILQDRYEQDQKRLEEMQKNELEDIQKEIKQIEKNLWQEYKQDEIMSVISDYQELAKDSEQLTRLLSLKEKYTVNEKKMQENQRTLEVSKTELIEKKDRFAKLSLQKELYKCPSCHVSLRFQDDVLQLHDGELIDDETELEDVQKEIDNLTRIINRMEYIIPEEQNKFRRYKETISEIEIIESKYDEILTKEEIENNIEYMKEYKRSQIELEKRKKKLETIISEKKFSPSLGIFKEQLTKQKEQIKSLETKIKDIKLTTIEEESLREMIIIQRQNKDRIEDYQKRLKSLRRELAMTTQQIEQLTAEHRTAYQEIRDSIDLEINIQGMEKTLEELNKKVEIHQKNMDKIELYKKYSEELGRYNEWKNKVKDLSEQEQKCRQKYAAAITLKDKILQAESMAILNIINSINAHAQEYLDLFFPTDPIVVRLLPFKQTKKNTNKPQINLEIDYKGMEADITMLSGGELSRVVLAYTLALSEIFNASLILLDECTASLDQELTSVVMEGIRKNFGNKLVVIIAHQVVSGNFDRQIAL